MFLLLLFFFFFFGGSESFLAAANLSPKKSEAEAFHLAHPSFSLSVSNWMEVKWALFMVSGSPRKKKWLDNRAWRSIETTWREP